MKVITINSVLYLFISISLSCTPPESSNSNIIIENFFDEYERDEYKAIDGLFLTNPHFNKNNEAILNLKEELKLAISEFGNYNGSEFIALHTTGSSKSFVIFSYLVKYDLQPIRFQFIFYKPKKDWEIFNFQFDTNLSHELETSSQLFFLPKTFESYD